MTNDTKETVIAFIRLASMAITTGVAMFGFAIDVELVYTILSVAAAAAAMLWGWWFNNNVTGAAKFAQEMLNIEKANTPRCDMVGDDDGDEA